MVDGGGRLVVAWTVLPAAVGLDDVQDARQDGAVIFATSAGLVFGHERRDRLPLLVRQPEQLSHYLPHLGGAWNRICHITAIA